MTFRTSALGFALFALGACGSQESGTTGGAPLGPTNGNATASRLDALAVESGALDDGHDASPVGSYGRHHESGQDRFCLRPAEAEGRFVFGAEMEIGEDASCHLTGVAQRLGDRLLLASTDGACRIEVQYEGDSLVFPGASDPACAKFCRGRGNLAGITFPSIAEGDGAAARVMGRDGSPLCG